MESKYLIKLVAGSYASDVVTTIPRRMLRTQSMDAIKQHLATQYNLSCDDIASIEPFYS